ncbi:MAG TPA: hypothetical protein VK789_27710 [Bryobacteraceae bacterium]|nr:hypothetical protein [Bryobacteraceae bacterium]
MIRVLLPILVLAGYSRAAESPVRRTILALYNGAQYKELRDTRIHRLLEMPLNHLGFVVRYQDIQTSLPSPDQMQDVRGIATWFATETMPHPVEFLQWAERAIDSGKRFVIIGELGASKDQSGRLTPVPVTNHFLAKMGLQLEDWTPVTYEYRVVHQDATVIGFERPLPTVLPAFERFRILDPRVRSHLTLRKNNDPATDAHLVVTGPHGAWVASGYTHFETDHEHQMAWYINPFEFLRLAFASDEVPKPDTTTLSGRRIYYSQIDGDGWRNVTEVPRYSRDEMSSAEVILREAIEPFPDLPVTVGPIAGDLDPEWFGTRETLAVARRILSLPWVEAGSHTYSHPLDWETLFKKTAGVATPVRTWSEWFDSRQWTAVNRVIERYSKPEADEGKASLMRGHALARSYNLYPFNPEKEIGGSIAFLNGLLPLGKRVAILQWSGTTLVPRSVLAATRRAGVRNINGGDTRLDPEFDSYAWVAPLSRQVGEYRQIYSSDSNENTYTNSWDERYYGFRYLPETLRRTESPMRIKPFDVYYHMYSGEKEPGVDAIVENLRYARTQQLTPITASQYAAIVDGFHSAEFTELGPRRWQIENRDSLNTIRFDHADGEGVDWAASKGVLGQRHFQGSLYVALDANDSAPVIALASSGAQIKVDQPYLIESRWRISKMCVRSAGFEFETQGFGSGEMEWNVAPDARYEVQVYRASRLAQDLYVASDHSGTLQFTVTQGPIEPVTVRVARSGTSK